MASASSQGDQGASACTNLKLLQGERLQGTRLQLLLKG